MPVKMSLKTLTIATANVAFTPQPLESFFDTPKLDESVTSFRSCGFILL